jgi:hypothetical protein
MPLKFIAEASNAVPAGILAAFWLAGWVYISTILRRILKRKKS